MRAVTAILGCLGAAGQAPAREPLPAPPSGLVERTRDAWIDIYRSWVERPDGGAIPVDPGPAFCLGGDGLLLADQNAVAGSLHLFATIRGRGPFPARARVFDPRSGLAAIEIHPGAAEGVPCLRAAGEEAIPIAKGDVLYALGPPGAGPVPLKVSRASPGSLHFSGGIEATFLAGSPLVDSSGRLRGVLVARASGGRIGRDQATGPLAGLARRRRASGAIPLAPVLALAEQLKGERHDGVPAPPAEPVVRASEGVFPRSLRGAAGVRDEDLPLYSAGSGEAAVEFLTPASLEAQEALLKFAYAPGRTFFRWPAHAGMWEPMIVVQQSPRVDPAAGSVFPKSGGTLGVERGAERFGPVDSFRDCMDDGVVLETGPGTYESRKVKGCRTSYLFPPEAFAPGAEVAVRLEPGPEDAGVAVPVRPETLSRIAADFSPWKSALGGSSAAEAPGRSPVDLVAPLPALGVPYATRSLGNAGLRITRPAGCSFAATRVDRSGKPAIRIPVIQWKKSFLAVAIIPGFLYAGRDVFSFEPVLDERTRQDAFTLSRAKAAVSVTGSGKLRIKADGKKRLFFFRLEAPEGLPGGVFGSAFSECQKAAGELAGALLDDFDRALQAFDEPGILGIKPPEPPRVPPAPEDIP